MNNESFSILNEQVKLQVIGLDRITKLGQKITLR